jgi:catechol 2,3-dioxygenase-like lactoylglutathione lyase family enzyme
MAITRLAHYSIRTTDLEASRRFYTEVLGFRVGYRPEFPFPGLWLYNGPDDGDFGIVHIIGFDANDASGLVGYLGDRAAAGQGTGVVDHIAFLATGLAAMHNTLQAARLVWRDRTVPTLKLHQVFFEDPSGVTVELNFPAAEAAALAGKAQP